MKDEIRKYITENGHVYVQKKEFSEKGTLTRETWIKKGEESFLISNVVFVSATTYCRLQRVYTNYTEEEKANNEKMLNLITIGKLEDYKGKEGKIVYLVLKGVEKGMWQSSPVIRIEPPFVR